MQTMTPEQTQAEVIKLLRLFYPQPNDPPHAMPSYPELSEKCCDALPKPPPGVPLELDRLEGKITFMQDRLNELESRLRCILKPVSTLRPDSNNKCEKPPLQSIVDRIHKVTGLVEALGSAVVDITNRLEV